MQTPLIYVVGPSGSGKDSLIRYARERLASQPGVCFAHRYITRPADAGGENHIALSEEEFAARAKADLFALHWRSHGLSYGIGIEINQWLAKGVTVVVNGSRGYLPQARKRYPELLPVAIEVSDAVLRARLRARGRETAEQIEARLQRHHELGGMGDSRDVIRNDGELAPAGEALVALIRRRSGALACA
ncbi:MAG: phosphonate metabolism protein/1,5-bisphosphokinase (PRPP-forming) PhnN [Pigmentiphaga sp.]|uniref:phosphonate metabolism protein/1,5-bisphosphokinase (PRPP-forming) PhnN n=1 Tax=Pigmentiphaga sp. TaxID=1977564 RepID=UPI0029B2822E|nr:phosphonate metabolism protein/1,5-bisphosphokinase (PRPP-forming) PhnN [Pigmentiphaga sp.]MDX3904899.1 phosphonate metabolism protein/1,5-bisphosphokinase (PRPP-forming) PhnN [Pigmentiphaga sp.]